MAVKMPRSMGVRPRADQVRERYAAAMGRDFTDPSPVPVDYGAPDSLHYAYCDVATRTHTVKDEYYTAFDAWKASAAWHVYLAAVERHAARQSQFAYSPARKNKAAILADAAI